jgi:Protein of unknown function, DUF481
VDRQSRNTVTLLSQRFLGARWSALGFSQFQQNEELSLDLRAVVGAGIQRMLVQSNRTELAVLGGLAVAREQYAGTDYEIVAEAVAGVLWDWFTFDGRSTNLDSSALSFYALNRARLRLELNTSFKSDIVGDLYWSINLFESYNSDPPAGWKPTTSACLPRAAGRSERFWSWTQSLRVGMSALRQSASSRGARAI